MKRIMTVGVCIGLLLCLCCGCGTGETGETTASVVTTVSSVQTGLPSETEMSTETTLTFDTAALPSESTGSTEITGIPTASQEPFGTAATVMTAATAMSTAAYTPGTTASAAGTAASGTASSVTGVTATTTTTAKATTRSTAKATTRSTAKATTRPSKPTIKGEMRGVWVSYIEMDALLRRSSTPSKAAAAIDALMDNCVTWHINTVVWMTRGHSDAYYKSNLYKPAPAAKALLAAGFDPLDYAIKAAHKRGIVLHAWVNPYRIGTDASYAVCSDYFYYSGKYYYIPTSAKARKAILDGLREIVQRYDVDGLHFDDYFYPSGCASETTAASFEKAAYEAYAAQATGGALTPGGWRRRAVDLLVSGAYDVAHKQSGCVMVVAPSHDTDKTYKTMYADTKKWLKTAGYVDYMCPQVYFGMEHSTAAFDKVVDEWRGFSRASGVRLCFGMGVYKIGLSPDRYAGAAREEWQKHGGDILKREVQCLRARSDVAGLILFSYTYLDAASHRDLESWTDGGKTIKQTYDAAVAEKELAALRSVL